MILQLFVHTQLRGVGLQAKIWFNPKFTASSGLVCCFGVCFWTKPAPLAIFCGVASLLHLVLPLNKCQSSLCAKRHPLQSPSLCNVSLQVVVIHVIGTSIQRAPHSPLVLPPGWITGSNKLVCLLTHFAGSSWNKKQKCWPLVREPVAMLFATSLGSGSAKISERSLDLPGQFRVSRGPYSLDNLQSSVTIYGSLSKPNSDSNRLPIRNQNTSENKVCCQAQGTSYEVGPGSMEMGQAQLGVGFRWQGLGRKNRA